MLFYNNYNLKQVAKKYHFTFLCLFIILVLLGLINLSIGSIAIPFSEIIDNLSGNKTQNNYIILNYRLPKTITAILVGIGLGISGLLMQTYFRNPLAGPFVLGISSGSSLGVALVIMGSYLFPFLTFSSFSLPLAACLGAFSVLLVIMLTANRLKNTMSTLIVGLMIGSFTTAFISILSYFSTAQSLQQFVFWSLGSINNLQWTDIGIISTVILVSGILLLFLIKPLNALLLGENYAQSLGVSIKKTQYITFIVTSLLTGILTAYVGPIAFIGLALPHVTKLIFNSRNHLVLIPAVAIIGAITMLCCDGLTNLTINGKQLPINAITSILGAPVVIVLLMNKNKKSNF